MDIENLCSEVCSPILFCEIFFLNINSLDCKVTRWKDLNLSNVIRVVVGDGFRPIVKVNNTYLIPAQCYVHTFVLRLRSYSNLTIGSKGTIF